MSLLDLLFKNDINTGIDEFETDKGAMLIDVRTPSEYAAGHIENAINIPVDEIEKINNIVKNKNTHIYTYCLSGSRSSMAYDAIKKFGYTNVKNIGGISSTKERK